MRKNTRSVSTLRSYPAPVKEQAITQQSRDKANSLGPAHRKERNDRKVTGAGVLGYNTCAGRWAVSYFPREPCTLFILILKIEQFIMKMAAQAARLWFDI